MKPVVRIGTRGSQLALWQAEWVRGRLSALHPQAAFELVTIKTQGDRILDVPLAKVGGKGLFVKEIEEALRDGRIDLAVHSMKDMPAELPEGLTIGAVAEREVPFDALVSRGGLPLAELPPGARVGTSSLRRAAQLLHARPSIDIVPLRGNLDTRLRKLETEGLSAVVLAAAGLRRLSLEGRITELLAPEVMLPAVGQGALCIECRAEDPLIARMLGALDHPATRAAVTAERAFLARLQGGCQVPIAAYATLAGGRITLSGLVAELDGSRLVRADIGGPAGEAARLGTRLAERLLAEGAAEILERLNCEQEPPRGN